MMNKVYVCSGRSQTLNAWAEEWGISYSCLQKRYVAGTSNLSVIDVNKFISKGVIKHNEWKSYKDGDFGAHLKKSRMKTYKRLNTIYRELKYGPFLRVA